MMKGLSQILPARLEEVLAAKQAKRRSATGRDRIAYNVGEVCAATGLGKTSIFEAIKSGELPSVLRCGRRLVLKDDLEAWLRGDRSAA